MKGAWEMHNRGLCVGKTVTYGHRGSAVGARRGWDKVQPSSRGQLTQKPLKVITFEPFQNKSFVFVFRNLSWQNIQGLKWLRYFSHAISGVFHLAVDIRLVVCGSAVHTPVRICGHDKKVQGRFRYLNLCMSATFPNPGYWLLLQVLRPPLPPRSPAAGAFSPASSAACVGTSLSPSQSTTMHPCWSRRMEPSPRTRWSHCCLRWSQKTLERSVWSLIWMRHWSTAPLRLDMLHHDIVMCWNRNQTWC